MAGTIEGAATSGPIASWMRVAEGEPPIPRRRLSVKDVDFDANHIIVRSGKGDRDRVTLLPTAIRPLLLSHLERVRRRHEADLMAGAGSVALPDALIRKYPNAGREWPWQWVFPATRTYCDPETRQRRRHHLHESVLQRAVRDAVRMVGIAKPASCHTSDTRSRPPTRRRL